MPDITTKTARDALEVRREPHWLRLKAGAYLGFRRGPDSWVVRFRGRDSKQQYKSLGDFSGTAKQKVYDEAKKAAEDWLAQMAGTSVGGAKRDNVKSALQTYLAYLRQHGRIAAADEAEVRFKQIVYGDKIADLSLERADKGDFLEWRDRLRPGRQPRSINRHVRSVVAGLNRAHSLGHIGNPGAWKMEPLQDDVDDVGDTAVYLTPDQRKALLKAASTQAALFLRALEITGARPGEIAKATVSDFNGTKLKLTHKKGRPPKLKARYLELNPDDVAFFAAQVKHKHISAPIFTEDGETPWRRHVWAREVRAAIAAHNEKAKPKQRIPIDANAYSFRHARISELLQVYGIDPLTVAAQTGTSLAMIEKTYLKFIPSAFLEKLKAVT